MPIFFPSMPLKKPRTECACQPVAFMSSFNVTPPGRFSRSRILAVLLPGRAIAGVFRHGAPESGPLEQTPARQNAIVDCSA